MTRYIGILTSGGDSPGLNAANRGVGKAAIGKHGMEVIGFRDGFRGLAENRSIRLDTSSLAGILTVGGKEEKKRAKARLKEIEGRRHNHTLDLAMQLEQLTVLEL